MSNSSPITIAFAEDHKNIREGLTALLESSGKFKVNIHAGNGRQMLDQLSSAEKLPDICIIDIGMKEMDGYDLISEIRKRWPLLPVLVYSVYDEIEVIYRMIKRGANGYLSKGGSSDELADALLAIHESGYYYSEIAGSDLFWMIREKVIKPIDLTALETALLRYAAEDLTHDEIASLLHISPGSLRGKYARLQEKINVTDRKALVAYGMRTGIIPLNHSPNKHNRQWTRKK